MPTATDYTYKQSGASKHILEGDPMRVQSFALVAALALGLGGVAQANTLAKAQYLAATCANCHGTNGQAQGSAVSLAGYDAAKLVETMKAFAEGKREATIMHQLAKGYTDDQLKAMAAFFASQKAR
jgi:cytochrome c553